MFWRLLNLLAVLGLLGSSVYAYTVKYDSILYAEQILAVKHQITAEQDQIDRLRAEWALLTRPERLQTLAEKDLGLQKLSLDQIVQVADLPNRPPKVDSIGRKLADLGLGEPTNTPADRKARGGAATPTSDKTR
jgi:cell division protein FtsL